MAHIEVIPLTGILESTSGGKLRRQIEQLVESGCSMILIDCSAVEFMDSSGLGSLVMGMKYTRSRNGIFALCGLNDQLKLLLDITDMAHTFEIYSSREAFWVAHQS
ncbi:MAG: STAS domain-containing protein [Elainella sp. Prado103]|nr:STAS domain-containing protein [Elainella sp. Prado103]